MSANGLVVAEKEEPNEFIKTIDETSNIDKSETIVLPDPTSP